MSTNEQQYEELMFGEKKSRWYQVAGLHGVEEALEENILRILIVHPTGAGKTLTSGLVFSSERVRPGREYAVQNAQLSNICKIANPKRHLQDVYQSHVFHNDSPAAAQYPGHLTTLDAYNIATEIRSHTLPVIKSTERAMDIISNDLVFDHKNIILPSSGKLTRKKSAFSDADAAFFGAMS